MSKGSCTLLLWSCLASAGLLSPAQAQTQPPQPSQQQPQQPSQTQDPSQFQPPSQQQQSRPQDLQQIWQMQQQQMRARISGAVQQLKTACQDELRNFCGTVTPGEGRLLLCMQAHEDKISRHCELALLETSRNIGKAVGRIETFARACWSDIQAYCSGTGGSVAQCVIDNHPSLSAACRAAVAATLPAAQPDQQQGQVTPGQAQGQGTPGQPSLIGLAIQSADGMMLGHVTGLKRRPDGSLEAIEADLGTPLGLGATSVLISPDDLRWKGDGVELQMAAEQVRSILQGQRR